MLRAEEPPPLAWDASPYVACGEDPSPDGVVSVPVDELLLCPRGALFDPVVVFPAGVLAPLAGAPADDVPVAVAEPPAFGPPPEGEPMSDEPITA